MNTKMTSAKNDLYKIILTFAILDVITGVLSLIFSTLVWQMLALVITATTLCLSITYCKKYPQNKKSNAGILVIGSLDFITGMISVLVVVMATQILAVIASGFTFFKAVKIFVQSQKAKKILDTTKPFITKVILKVAPILGARIVSKYQKFKIKNNKGENSPMNKFKQFFIQLGNGIRANKGSLSSTILNGSAWGLLSYLASSVELVAIDVFGINITPFLAIIGFVLVELGFHWESFGTFISRISPKIEAQLVEKKAKAEAKAQAEAEKAQAEKIAKAQALNAKKKAEAEAEAKAKAKAEQEAKLLAEKEAKAKAEQEEIEKLAQELEKAEKQKEIETKIEKATTNIFIPPKA